MKIKDRWIALDDSKLRTFKRNKSPFGMESGREDFRGIVIPSSLKLKENIFRSTDLSRAVLPVWVERNVFADVVLVRTTLGISDHGNEFVDCIFERADFRGAVLGFQGSTYTSCRFIRCIFSNTGFIKAVFSGCAFESCKMNGCDFNASSFEQCSFKGRYDNLWFRADYKFPNNRSRFGEPKPNRMDGVSFEHAELHRVAFSQGCPLDNITLPINGNYTLIKSGWRKLLLSLQHQAALTPGPVGKEINIFARAWLENDDRQDQYLLNNDDILEDYGEEAAKIILATLA